MENKEVTLFSFKNRKVRVVMKDGEPWFVAKDVCDILGHTNSRMALEMLDDGEKGVSKVYTPGGNQEMNVVSESGIYSLIFRSNRPEAKLFRRWVTHEVLPAIRKTGRYAAPQKKYTRYEIEEAGRSFFTDCYREGGLELYVEKRYPDKYNPNDPRNHIDPITLLTRKEKNWLEELESTEFLAKEGRL
jgi:prophage antirepressor-like protein